MDNNTVTLTDTRGSGQNYTIRKLADNHCWMVDNLKLGPSSETGSLTIDSTNTNLTSGSFTIGGEVHDAASHAHGICVGGIVSGSGSILTCDGTEAQNTTNSPFSAYTDVMQYDKWCKASSDWSKSNFTDWPSGSSTGCGYLYNWYTASAGTSWSDQQNGDGDIMPSDICPKNWHIPTGKDASGEFAILNASMNANSLRPGLIASSSAGWQPTNAWRGIFSGTYGSGFGSRGSSFGYYWSSSVNSATFGYSMYFNSSYVDPGTSYGIRYAGYAVRCMV
jgi:uncharacterized protein (TIGR02145 family)